MEYKEIGIDIHSAQKSNDKADVKVYECCLTEQCPLYKQNQCLLTKIEFLSISNCPYGKIRRYESSTKRSKSYSSFIQEWKEKQKNLPKSPESYYGRCFQIIGDWVYLPYSQMNHKDGEMLEIPFEEYSTLFRKGSNFMKLDVFNAETILKLAQLRPLALTLEEIVSYQKEELPKFFFHLKYKLPELYNEVIKLNPDVKKYTENIKLPKSLNCSLKYIEPNRIDGYLIENKCEVKKWNGEQMVCCVKKLSLFWHTYPKDNNFEISFFPDKEKTKVEVIDKKLIEKLCLEHPEFLK